MSHPLTDAIFAANQQLYEHVKCSPYARNFPIEDCTDWWWWIDGYDVQWEINEDEARRQAFSRVAPPYSNNCYSGQLVRRQICRGAELTAALVDTLSDSGKLLVVFRNDHEVVRP